MAGSSSATTDEERQRVVFLLGPWLIGCFIDIFLQGALFSQFAYYFTWHNTDGVGTRLAVAGLVLLTTLKAIHSVAIPWIIFILHFKDLEGAILLNTTRWWQTGNPVMVATINIYVQVFFLRRLWVVSRRNIFYVLPVGAVLLFAYISVCFATDQISQGKRGGKDISMWFAAHLSSVFAGDLLLTVLTAYLLLKSRNDVLPQTVGLLRALVRLTFQTAAPAALCAMFNLIVTQVHLEHDNLISVAFNQALPKLYAFSMMWTLNARRSIRADNSYGNSIGQSDPETRRRGDVELSTYSSQIQMQTPTTTTQHIDDPESDDMKDHAEALKRKGQALV